MLRGTYVYREHDPSPQANYLPVLSLRVLVDIDSSDTAHFLFRKLSCFCGGLAEGKDLELCVGVQACTLEGKVLLAEMGRKKTPPPKQKPPHFGRLEKYCHIRFC